MLKKIVRHVHIWLVKHYTPADDLMDLADALFERPNQK